MQSLQNNIPPIPSHIIQQISNIPSNRNYILIYPSSNTLKQYSKLFNINQIPYLLIFEDTGQLTSKDIALQYLNQNNIKLEPFYIYFEEMQNKVKFRHMKLSELKRNIQQQNIDGICLQMTIFQSDIEQQAGLITLVKTISLPKKDKYLNFYIKQINFYFYIQQLKLSKFQNLQDQIINYMNKKFKIMININNLKLTVYFSQKQQLLTQYNYEKLTTNDYIYVQITDKNTKISKPKKINQNNFVFIVDQRLSIKIKYQYQQLNMLKISTILEKYLNYKNYKLNPNQYGIRIHQFFIKPYERFFDFSPIQQLFRSDGETMVKYVFAQVCKQSDIFYAHMIHIEDLSSKHRPNFDKIVENSASNRAKQKECDKVSRDRAKTCKNPSFKNNYQKIEPIIYYSSQLSIKQNGISRKLYDALNQYLRKMKFGELSREQYTKWQLLFAKSLFKNLLLIQEYKGNLFRGVSYKQKYKINQKVQFKQFISCSTSQSIARGFAKTILFIFKNCSIGRYIEQFSLYHEKQVLNLPYIEYEVTNVQVKKDIQQVTLKQVYVPRLNMQLNDQNVLYVLWLNQDKNIKQDINLSKNVALINQSTFFMHMKSTQQLSKWFKQNQLIIKDNTVNVVLITNMYREQNGKANEYAGVEAVKEYRKYYKDGRILVYVGNVKNAKDKLIQNNIQIKYPLTLSNSQADLGSFFAECGVK